MKTKVFGVGLNKTGTTTLGDCLIELGYNHQTCRPDLMQRFNSNELEPIFAVTDQFDSFEDWPFPLLYKEFFDRYPDAKFVLTVRKDAETWFKSLVKHSEFTKPLWSIRKAAYGYHYPHHQKEHHIRFYQRHNQDVEDFFRSKGAENQLLKICWETGDGWPELCKFLDLPIVKDAIPHSNKSASRKASGFEKINKTIVKFSKFLHGR